MSFLRARPNCGSPYHESKWAAEEIIRNSGLDYTIVKAGMIYGRGDHMLDHLSHSLHTLPFFATVGFKEKPIRPLAIDDLVRILRAALVDARLNRQTVPVTGAEQLNLSEAARRVAGATSRRILILPAPVWFHFVLAQIFEFSMTIPGDQVVGPITQAMRSESKQGCQRAPKSAQASQNQDHRVRTRGQSLG